MVNKLWTRYDNEVHSQNMFGRQWFGPGSQFALDDQALLFEKILRKREFSKAIEVANLCIQNNEAIGYRGYWLRQRSRAIRLQGRSINRSVITVAFDGFWNGFNFYNNEILNLFKHCAYLIGSRIEINSEDPDILIFSCFGDVSVKKYKNSTRILYLGENVRPDYSQSDYSLSFDMSEYCGRNIYLPLWLLRSSKYAINSQDYKMYDSAELEMPRLVNTAGNTVVYIGNNSTPSRIEAINELAKNGITVDCFGSQTRPVSDKIETLQNYQYSLCFENTYTPGYVTEKLIDSFIGGTRPIYWGGAPHSIFNLSEHFVCDPYQNMKTNIKNFLAWKQYNSGKYLPQLLKTGAFARTESYITLKLSKIMMDLF